MTRYGGTKALDAEMKIDFTNNTILMDYSTVKGAARTNSNTGVVLSSEWDTAHPRERLKYTLLSMAIHFTRMMCVFPLYCIYFLTLANRGIIKSAEGQYDHQCLMKYYYTILEGTIEKTVSGEQHDTKLTIYIWNNMYFDYKLEGEYQEKIKSISLVRNYMKYNRYGVFAEIRQIGWNVIFEFTEPPKSGSCTVTCIG